MYGCGSKLGPFPLSNTNWDLAPTFRMRFVNELSHKYSRYWDYQAQTRIRILAIWVQYIYNFHSIWRTFWMLKAARLLRLFSVCAWWGCSLAFEILFCDKHVQWLVVLASRNNQWELTCAVAHDHVSDLRHPGPRVRAPNLHVVQPVPLQYSNKEKANSAYRP